MQNTIHYNLKKPDKTDVIKIDDLNYNADIIDSELYKKALKTDIPSSLPADGGNADTIGGKSPSDFATAEQGMKADTALQSDELGKTGGAAKHDELISDYYKKIEVDGNISTEVNRLDAQMADIVQQSNENKTGLDSKQDKDSLLNDIGDNYFNKDNYGNFYSVSAVTLNITHANSCLSANSTVTIPNDTSVTFPSGTQITVFQYSGQVTFVPASGVTLRSKDTKRSIDGIFASATLIKVGTNTWYLIGALK